MNQRRSAFADKLATRTSVLVMLFIGLMVPSWAIGDVTNQTSAWHGPGMAYYCDMDPKIPLAVHVVKVDRSQRDLELHTTMGGFDQIGVSTLSEQAQSISPKIGKPLAAINGDYFNIRRPFVGDPMNLQILRGGELISGPGEDRAFFYLDAKGEPHITNAVDAFTVTWPDGRTTPIGLNQTPMTGQAVLYTTAAGTNTRVDGIDLVLVRNGQDPWLPLRVGQTLTAKVRQINKEGYSALTPDNMVLSLSPRTLDQLPALTPGMVLKVCTATKPDLAGAILAIGGGPSLVRDGKIRETPNVRGYDLRHPRSAFGWSDKYYFFVQADGRQPRHSMGMTLKELAQYFVKLGCTHAINLDGGGSCTTWVAGRTVNNPSQGKERPSANALVLVQRKPPGG